MDQPPPTEGGREHTSVVTNLPPVEGREQLSAVTNSVMMSGTQRDKAFVHLRELARISEQQEETIGLSIRRVCNNAKINPYKKKRGKPGGQKNKYGHKVGRPMKKRRR